MDFQLLLLEQRVIKTWRKLKKSPPKFKDRIKNWDLHKLGQKDLELIHDHVDYLTPAERRRWEGFIRARNEFQIHYLVFDDVKTYNRKVHFKRTDEVDRILEDLGKFAPISSKAIFEYLEVNDWIDTFRHPGIEHANRGELSWYSYDDSVGDLMQGLHSSVCMPANTGKIKFLHVIEDHFKTKPKTKKNYSKSSVTFVTEDPIEEDLYTGFIVPCVDEIKTLDYLEDEYVDEYDYNPFKPNPFTGHNSIAEVTCISASSIDEADSNVWIDNFAEPIVKLVIENIVEHVDDINVKQVDAMIDEQVDEIIVDQVDENIDEDHGLPLFGKKYQNIIEVYGNKYISPVVNIGADTAPVSIENGLSFSDKTNSIGKNYYTILACYEFSPKGHNTTLFDAISTKSIESSFEKDTSCLRIHINKDNCDAQSVAFNTGSVDDFNGQNIFKEFRTNGFDKTMNNSIFLDHESHNECDATGNHFITPGLSIAKYMNSGPTDTSTGSKFDVDHNNTLKIEYEFYYNLLNPSGYNSFATKFDHCFGPNLQLIDNLDLTNEWKSAPNHREIDSSEQDIAIEPTSSSDSRSCLSTVQSFMAPYSTPVSNFPDSPIEFKDITSIYNEMASPACHEDNIHVKNIPKLKRHAFGADSVGNPLSAITTGMDNVNKAFIKAIVRTDIHDNGAACFETVRFILRDAIHAIRAITDCEGAFEAADLINGVIAKAVTDITAVNPDNTHTEAVDNFNSAINDLIDTIDDMIATKNIYTTASTKSFDTSTNYSEANEYS